MNNYCVELKGILMRSTYKIVQTMVFSALCLIGFATLSVHGHAQIVLPQVGNIGTVAGNGSVTRPQTGDGSGPITGVGGAATKAELSGLNYLSVDTNGNIYIGAGICCRGAHYIPYEIPSSTGIVNLISNLSASEVWGMATDINNNFYIASSPDVVQELNATSGLLTTIAGNGSSGCTGDNGPASAAEFSLINGLAVGTNGNIYIVDYGCEKIRMINASTGIVTTIAGNGNQGCSGDNGPATSADLNTMNSVAVDRSGNVYVASTTCQNVREINAGTGIISTVAGNGTSGYSGDGGPATSAELSFPSAVAVDTPGNLYISDSNNNRIRLVAASTGIITTLGGTGSSGYSGDGGPAANAEISGPAGITLGEDANIYFIDSGNNRLRVIGTPTLSTSVLYPAYQVTSIIYAAPGNKSQDGFTNTTTSGTTTTLGDSFTNASTITFSEGISAFGASGGASQSFGVSASTTSSHAFNETFTDATSVSNQSNSSNPNAINHLSDLFLIWLNPQLSVTLQGATPVSYSVGVQGQVQPDILEIFAGNMLANASGQTTVPAAFLNQQTDPATGAQTPGLASVCVHLNTAEYAANACTLADQCGCQASDFAPIIALDPLVNFPGTETPLDANVDSSTVCGSLPTPSGNCRYVPVPTSKGSPVQETQLLAGPANQGGNYSCNSFTQSDANSTTQTLGGSTSESVSVSFKQGSPIFSLTQADTLTWMQSHSIGTSNGTGNSQSVTFCSATVGCGEDIAIYEDTLYHTFVFQQPAGNLSCP